MLAFIGALKKMHVKPTDSIVVENAPLGVEAANRAGIACFVVLHNTPLSRADFGDSVKDDRIFEKTGSLKGQLLGFC